MDERPEPIRFYWSFRSPYAWLAAERLADEYADIGAPVEHVPVFPTADLFPNDPSAHPAKVAYLVQDVSRLARERGLSLRFPQSADTDWALPHAAFLEAERQGAGTAFQLGVFRKRFGEGRDVGDEAVVAEASREAGLDPAAVVKAGRDPAQREQVAAGWAQGMERDGIFGVPSFVYAGRLYFGQDRMHFLRSAVARKSGGDGAPAEGRQA